MGPTIILDKSSVQTLSAHEIVVLKKQYSVNIAPVLIIEILADLKKEIGAGQSPEQEVIQLANKLSQYDSAVNVHYRTLVEGSLIGNKVKMERRPIVGSGRLVKSTDGKMGIVFEETLEELAILRWQDGLFSEAEHAVARQWRISTKSIDLEQFKKDYKSTSDFDFVTNLQQLNVNVDKDLEKNDNNPELLKMIILEFGFDQEFASKVFMRWESGNNKSIKSFCPYALFCFKANLIFYLGLVKNLLGTRPTNRVDLEYIYYLPFCSVFSSKDKFHKNLVPLFLESDQQFISGEDLKNKLITIGADLKDQAHDEITKRATFASSNEKSQTHLQNDPFQEIKTTGTDNKMPKDKKVLIDEINEIADLPEYSNSELMKNYDESKIDFMIRKSSVRLSSLCPCGSGKKFKDCHWTPDMKTK